MKINGPSRFVIGVAILLAFAAVGTCFSFAGQRATSEAELALRNQYLKEVRSGNFANIGALCPNGAVPAGVSFEEFQNWKRQIALKEATRSLLVLREGRSHLGTCQYIAGKLADAGKYRWASPEEIGVPEREWFQLQQKELSRARAWAWSDDPYQFEQVTDAVAQGVYTLPELHLSAKQWQMLKNKHLHD